ncbi:MAG: hypothetical protein KDC54_15960, partial [Lewinella sp.]|nr:hypothetical protein [Lewinella sp.]
SIQTLGTFLSSNEDRPWYILWIFAGGILTATMVYGWFNSDSQRVSVIEKQFPTETGYSGAWADQLTMDGETYYFNHRQAKAALGKEALYTSAWDLPVEEQEAQRASLKEKDTKALTIYQEAPGGQLERVGEAQVRAVDLYQVEVTLSGETSVGTLAYEQVNDVSYNRLEKYDLPYRMPWPYLLPPLVLLLLTRTGIPVSTSFLILTFFNPKNLQDMVLKSLMGYALAFIVAIVVYAIITNIVEKRFIERAITRREKTVWSVLQWGSTGFLWSMWLIQDFANIFVYLPRSIPGIQLVIALTILLALLAYIFANRGGEIQKIVKAKTNTVDIRSATIIDFTYALLLLYFKELNNVPMSTTWVFIGLLAGREIAIRFRLKDFPLDRKTWRMLGSDLIKVAFGLLVSIALVFVMRWLIDGF